MLRSNYFFSIALFFILISFSGCSEEEDEFVRFNCSPDCINNYIYAWEDINNDNQTVDIYNDADYNDLVIHANQEIVEGDNRTILKLKFSGAARGASYNHEMKVNLQIKGKYAVNGGAVQNGDGKVTIDVFDKTGLDIPANNIDEYTYGTNTWDINCLEAKTKEFTIEIYGSLQTYSGGIFESVMDPFIIIKAVSPTYSLHIWQITGDLEDTYTFNDRRNIYPSGHNRAYPNGIVIPQDWQWPLETNTIWAFYPEFSDVSSWNSDWHLTKSTDQSIVFNKSAYDECI